MVNAAEIRAMKAIRALKAVSAGPYIARISGLLLVACLLVSFSCSQSPPVFQSVSGEFAQKWIEDYKKETGIADPPGDSNTIANQSQNNQSDLWSWGSAPRGSRIIDDQLERDPNYLRPMLDLSSNWLDEQYTDSQTGLPVKVYSDPFTGRKYHHVLNPNTGIEFFTYCSYEDEKTGQTVYVYTDPDTGEEVQATSEPVDIIKSLAARSADNLI